MDVVERSLRGVNPTCRLDFPVVSAHFHRMNSLSGLHSAERHQHRVAGGSAGARITGKRGSGDW